MVKRKIRSQEAASHRSRFGVRFWLTVDAMVWLLLGLAAILAPLAAGLATVLLFATLLIIAGLIGLITLARTGRRGAWGWRLVSAAAALLAGALLIYDPLTGAWTLTIVVGAYLILSGVTAVRAALQFRRLETPGWYWLFATAAVDFALAILAALLSPVAAPLFLGYLLGVDLVISGAAMLAFARSRPVAAWDQRLGRV